MSLILFEYKTMSAIINPSSPNNKGTFITTMHQFHREFYAGNAILKKLSTKAITEMTIIVFDDLERALIFYASSLKSYVEYKF